ncbi:MULTISPECIES: hypothetical protein [unclassified Flavobacterium]|uniref:hypothetical protein n=1 Tax=unclassified Flavobacterium TaxID=196869 RepID=UPI00156F7B07|nr:MULTISPECIES: hypothetical protein [unclassified Flavobacterium]MBE0391958.1 hypothetical protein [Flavobacterium sp. PL002]NRT15039.1 hypothetical protein [Flavobacterium sp. 28A]
MKKYILLLLIVAGNFVNAQSVNNYKAVVVPIKFDFLKSDNAYRLNTLSKFNLKKAGFEAFYSNEQMPKQFAKRCDLLYLNVEKESGFLVTKLFVTLKDCEGKLVFQSETGRSKDKEYETAYVECLNQAFESINALHYIYAGAAKKVVVETEVEEEDIPETIIKDESVQNNATTVMEDVTNAADLLYAQPIENGYQLVDASPKVVMKVTKTSSPSTYIATKGEVQGVLVAKNGAWYFEYYKDEKLVSEKIAVKF